MNIKREALEKMSSKELQTYKMHCYDNAKGIIQRISTLSRVLGKKASSDYLKYNFHYSGGGENIDVHVDCHGNFMTVYVNNKKMCSTHPCEKLFVDGPWVKTLLSYERDAMAVLKENKEIKEAEIKRKLLKELLP